jgi:hypothetical protein
VLTQAAIVRAHAHQTDKYEELADPGPACDTPVAVSEERAARLDTLLASRDAVRSATPQMVRDLIIDQEDDHGDDTPEANDANKDTDLARVLAGSMAMYIEWPHIDRQFKQVYATMAGRYAKHWAARSDTDGDPSLDDNRE